MKAIVAMAENRVIGYRGRIPWKLPEDLKFFKETTWGTTVVMGRKTYESIGRPLPGRRNVVLTRVGFAAPPGVFCATHLQEAVRFCEGGEAFVIGGELIYQALLSFCNEIIVTHVKGYPQGDTFFPIFEEEFGMGELLRESPEMRIVRYLRIRVEPFS